MNKQKTEITIGAQYFAKVIFECEVEINDYYYLVIYGKHKRGYFGYISGEYGVEMAEPSDTFYNSEKLMNAGAPEWLATGIAKAIKYICEKLEPKKSPAEEAAEVEKKFADIFNSASVGSK